jgi:pyruvate,water dikinase
MLTSNTGRSERTADRHGEHLAARDELHRHLKPWQRKLVDHLLNKISAFIALRENTRHYHIMLFDTVRQKILEIEQQLLLEGQLKIEGDIFFLRHRELEGLTTGQLNAASAHELVRRRRREWARAVKMPVEETINIALPSPEISDDALRGQCACPGQVEATARVIHSLSEADKLAAGEILVAPYTDPAWTPLFTRAAGIVVGTGSFLSHAGTVARELHVPCIVDVKHCMHRIIDGQRIRIDASNGAVEVLS